MAKDTFFCPKKTLNLGGKIINLSPPLVMGIMNITPDSFYDGGKFNEIGLIIQHTAAMLKDEADIIDLGAASTRPGSPLIAASEEQSRLIPVLKALVREFPDARWSVDTYNATTAERACDEGAHMINDISGGSFDPMMIQTIARLQVPYVIMHIQGKPENMQENPVYTDLVRDISGVFHKKIDQIRQSGVNDIIIDPGFGFGKTLSHNYQLLQRLDYFKIFGLPIMVGLSRKSMIGKLLNMPPSEALNATTVLNTMALIKGADMLRVHDVRQAREAVKIFTAFMDSIKE